MEASHTPTRLATNMRFRVLWERGLSFSSFLSSFLVRVDCTSMLQWRKHAW